MFCPFCKAEYRAGISRCSDCSFTLVESVPQNDADPDFMVLLWNGESLPFLEAVCAELDRAEFPVAAPRVEVLLRDSADRYHLKHLRTFPYVLGVFKRDFATARNILESVAEKSSPPVLLPPVAAYPEPFDERPAMARGTKSDASLDATSTIYSSQDLRAIEFLEASLDVINIPSRRVSLESGAYEIQVRPKDEVVARQVAEEIARGTSSQAAAAVQEDALLQDEPPKSHFLVWFMVVLWQLIWIVTFTDVSSGHATSLAVFLFLAGLAYWGGMFWIARQAERYEARPFKYYVAALIPLAFVWYFIERVMGRKGLQKLPVSLRVRMRPPQT